MSGKSSKTSSASKSRAPRMIKPANITLAQLAEALALSINQNYMESDASAPLVKISNGQTLTEEVMLTKLKPKYRLFSHFSLNKVAGKKNFNIENVVHFLPIKTSFYYAETNTLQLRSDSKRFSRVRRMGGVEETESMELEQIFEFNLTSNDIVLQVREVKPVDSDVKSVYNFISKYKLVNTDSGSKIVPNPVTREEHKIIKPIRRYLVFLRRLGNPKTNGINIYAFLNTMLKSDEQITFGSRYADIKEKSQRLFNEFKTSKRITDSSRIVVAEDKLVYDSFEYSNNNLEDEESFNQYKKMLSGWRKNYTNWSNKPDINPIETFQYKFEINPSKTSKDKLSNTMVKLLERLQLYDPENIKLEKDTETVKKLAVIKAATKDEKDREEIVEETVEITKSVDFGVYPPYLVSDLIRQNNKNIEGGKIIYSPTLEWVPLSEYNIDEFASFIHNFKSGAFETVSLLMQLYSKYSFRLIPEVVLIKFNHLPIYGTTIWNPYTTKLSLIKSNIIQLKLDQTFTSNILTITASKGEVTDGRPEDLVLIPLDEPNYGRDEFSRVTDFDLDYADMVSSSSALSSLSSNFKIFFELFTREVELGELLPSYVEPTQLEKLDEDWVPIPGSKPVETTKPLSIWANLAKLITAPFTSGVEETEEEKAQRERVRAVLAPSTPEQIAIQQEALIKSREAEDKRIAEAKAERLRIKRERREKEDELERMELTIQRQPEIIAHGHSAASVISEAAPEIVSVKAKTPGNKSGHQRAEASKLHRLIEEAQGVRKIASKKQEQIEQAGEKAVSERSNAIYDLIIAMRKFRTMHEDRAFYVSIVDAVRNAGKLGYFSAKSGRTNETFVREFANETLNATLEELAKEKKVEVDLPESLSETPTTKPRRKPRQENPEERLERGRAARGLDKEAAEYEQKYLKYKAKYLQLKKLLEEQK
jgi:hypothetical protein